MEQRFITESGLADLLGSLQDQYSIFHPVATEKALHIAPYPGNGSQKNETEVSLGEVRPCEPLKAFYFTARKRVAVDFGDDTTRHEGKPLCLVGVKACDLKSLQVLDSVFVDSEYGDPFYNAARRDNLIISSDCTAAIDTCFCIAMHGKPFPQNDYDLNLSHVPSGYVVDVGSDKGEQVVNNNAKLFDTPTDEQLQERDDSRRQVEDQVRKNIQDNQIPDQDELAGVIARNSESEIWREESETCVECGACNAVCPTCHCFLLYDQQHDKETARFRLWDSCLIKDFAEVAGGANPRSQLWMRLRNRFEKKFDFFPAVKGFYACTGCGRCIGACPGKIDIRRVLKRNVEGVRA